MKEKDEGQIVELRVKLSASLKRDIESLAKSEGQSTAGFVRSALKLYVRERYYQKAEELLNFEDRIGTALLLELQPQLEDMIGRIEELVMILESRDYEEPKKEEEMPREESKEKIPNVPGLKYRVDGKNVIYEDGSVYSVYLGTWLIMKDRVLKWRREMEKNYLGGV